jgi:hypothetical protein
MLFILIKTGAVQTTMVARPGLLHRKGRIFPHRHFEADGLRQRGLFAPVIAEFTNEEKEGTFHHHRAFPILGRVFL